MSRAVLASAMLTRLRSLTDTVNNTHITDTEGYTALTSAVGDTWDKILSSGTGDFFVKKVTFSTVPGTKEYDVATICPDGDFFKVHQVLVDEGLGLIRPITRINPYEEQAYRAPVSAVPMVMYYIPCAPVWTTGSESFDGINGWEEHTIVTAAMFICVKRGDDYSWFRNRKQELEARILTAASRSVGEPARVVRKRRSRENDRYIAWNNSISCWDLRGNNIELFYRYGYSL
jgi:hypothetical protein